MRPRQIVIVAFPGFQALDVVGPHEAFAGAARVTAERGGPPAYGLELVTPGGGSVTSESGLALAAAPLPCPRPGLIDTLVVPGGGGVLAARNDPALVEWVTVAAARSRRVASVCSGAFLAGAAGLLAGRRVTTHWARARQLAADYPDALVDPDPIYLRDGNIWTSAGVTAGIDLALALVEQDEGAEVAQMVARWLVMYRHRPGGQTQFATPVWLPRAERAAVRAVQERVESDPGGDHRLSALAAAAAMSVRHFARVFRREVGETPGRYVERIRLEAARRLLEESDLTLTAVAARSGLGSAENLRRVAHRRLGVAPDAYRRRFRTAIQDPDQDPGPDPERKSA